MNQVSDDPIQVDQNAEVYEISEAGNRLVKNDGGSTVIRWLGRAGAF
jgi:hypothetical protein